MKKATVIGHFGANTESNDGQTVKTKTITCELVRQYGENEICAIDTHGGIKTLFRAPRIVRSAYKTSSNVIILPAQNGLRVFAPLCARWKRKKKTVKLHYVVIGGWLPAFLKDKPKLTKYLKQFDYIYVETKTMKTALEKQGFANVVVMPNCKEITILEEKDLVYSVSEPLKLCTFSRVMREKGIEDAVKAVIETNHLVGREVYHLDIYGQIDDNQREWFNELKGSFPPFIKYKGVVPYCQSVEIIKDYFALLFPTFYEGEGFAGTLIDAFSAGLPVIASDWKYNTDIVTDGTGLLFPAGDVKAFVKVLTKIADAPSLITNKKSACIKEAKKYDIYSAIKVLIGRL